MKLTKESVLKALSEVQDPDLKKDLVTLDMIKDISIQKNELTFSVELTTPACPMKELIRKDCESAINKMFGDNLSLNITMTSSVTSIRNQTPILTGVKNIIAVASGKGGVGKSTVTSNLAIALSRAGADVGIIDADIFGPSIPTMFNCEHEQPTLEKKEDKNWIVPVEQYGVKMMSIGFLSPPEGAVVWRGPMASSALKQFLGDTNWGNLDYLLIDLPPGTSDIHLTLVQTVAVTGAVMVTTPQKVALTDAQKGIAMFRQNQVNVPILGLVENMAYFTPEELPNNKYFLFGMGGGEKLAKKYDIPILGQIPIVQSIRESGDTGYPSAMKDDIAAKSFADLASNVARQVAIRNANSEQTKKVNISV